MDAPVVTIFVRHNPAKCKQTNEQWKRCNCRKYFRWSTGSGKTWQQFKQAAATRSWSEAEHLKRRLEDELAGVVTTIASPSVVPFSVPTDTTTVKTQSMTRLTSFLKEKAVSGVSKDVQDRYAGLLTKLQRFCEHSGVRPVPGITREMLTGFCATWPDILEEQLKKKKKNFFFKKK